MMNMQAKKAENDFDRAQACPYNPAHVMLRGRNQTHLMKCRKQYELDCKNKIEYVPCSFNSTHIMPVVEIDVHELDCPDRRVIDDLLAVEERTLEAAPIHSKAIVVPECEEDWNDDVTERPVLEMVQERAKTKPVLLQRHGVPPAERKKHRLEENKRHRELNEKK